jgi:DNA-directed RNA polymerase specialized sigma24 family protein
MSTPDPRHDLPELNELPPRDDALMERVKARDLHAFSLLFDRYARPVYAMAAHLLGPTEAEEIVQEVFWRVWKPPQQNQTTRETVRECIMPVPRH